MRILALFFVTICLSCGSEHTTDNLEMSTDVTPPTEQGIESGYLMATSQALRSGLVRISHNYGSCSGVVLHSSASTNSAWILTAAHCFMLMNDDPTGFPELVGVLYYVPGLAVHYPPDSPTNIAAGATATAITHPDFVCAPGEWPCDDIWYEEPDLALLHLDGARVPMMGPRGLNLLEYDRPIFCGRIADYAGHTLLAFGQGAYYCDWPASDCRHDDRPRFAQAYYFTIDSAGYLDVNSFLGGSILRPGDSGGPWLYSRPTFNRFLALERSLDDGVVVGTFSGVDVEFPLDVHFYAKSTSGPAATSFIVNNMGADAFCTYSLPWQRSWTWWERLSLGERVALMGSATSQLL